MAKVRKNQTETLSQFSVFYNTGHETSAPISSLLPHYIFPACAGKDRGRYNRNGDESPAGKGQPCLY